MAGRDGWRSFGEVVSTLVDAIGSDLIAWDDIENHLISGRIRSKADFNRLHELTGAILKTEERILKADWWREPGRFGRLHGKLVLWTEVETYQANSWSGFERAFRNPTWSCTNIMLWMPNVVDLYPKVVDRHPTLNVTSSQPSDLRQSTIRQRGPKPSVSERVKAEMRQVPPDELRKLKMEEMRVRFRASFDTCARARNMVLSEFSGD